MFLAADNCHDNKRSVKKGFLEEKEEEEMLKKMDMSVLGGSERRGSVSVCADLVDMDNNGDDDTAQVEKSVVAFMENRTGSKGPFCTVPKDRLYSEIGVTDLRSLVLSVFDDAYHGPDFIKIHNKIFIRHVIAIALPGICPETFGVNSTTASNNKVWRTTKQKDEYIIPSSLTFPSRMLPFCWLPRAPGDTHRLFSPVGAFLTVPLHKGEKATKRQKRVNDVAATLEELILSEDAMLELAYPGAEEGKLEGWVQSEGEAAQHSVYALDCEMCQTEVGMEITRISLIHWDGSVAFDKFVRPLNAIVDYLTKYSGVSEKSLVNVTTTLADIQKLLLQFIKSNTTLLGQSLNFDFRALKFVHGKVIDTCQIYHHSRGPPVRPKLKWLASKYLKRDIQRETAVNAATGEIVGHDSVEDARACLDLVKLKMERGVRFGTVETDMESLFNRLSKVGIKSAAVDYGNVPFNYREADETFSCTSDEEVEQAIEEVIKDRGCRFVFAKFREVEQAAGWNMRYQAEQQQQETSQVPYREALLSVDGHINRVMDALPAHSLVIVFSGTGDPRPMFKMNAKRAHCERKKGEAWDKLTEEDQWTDLDDQVFERSVQSARTSVAFIGGTSRKRC